MSANDEPSTLAVPEECRGALAKALKLVEARDRFASDLRRRLTEAGFEESAVDFAMGFLTERKMIDDARVVDLYLRQKIGKRAMGRERLKADLIRRGAPEDVVEGRLAAISFESEQEDLDALVSLRVQQGDSRARIARFAHGRGYEGDAIEAALIKHFESE